MRMRQQFCQRVLFKRGQQSDAASIAHRRLRCALRPRASHAQATLRLRAPPAGTCAAREGCTNGAAAAAADVTAGAARRSQTLAQSASMCKIDPRQNFTYRFWLTTLRVCVRVRVCTCALGCLFAPLVSLRLRAVPEGRRSAHSESRMSRNSLALFEISRSRQGLGALQRCFAKAYLSRLHQQSLSS